jgi:hypothetical protein
MRASAREHGCTYHRAWYAKDGSAFYALAHWRTLEGFEEWQISDEPGEVATVFEGDVGSCPPTATEPLMPPLAFRPLLARVARHGSVFETRSATITRTRGRTRSTTSSGRSMSAEAD